MLQIATVLVISALISAGKHLNSVKIFRTNSITIMKWASMQKLFSVKMFTDLSS